MITLRRPARRMWLGGALMAIAGAAALVAARITPPSAPGPAPASPKSPATPGAPAANSPAPAPPPAPVPLPRILVFTKTAGYRHDSIPDGIRCVREITKGRFDVDATEDAASFNRENLARYRAVVFLSTSGEILDDPQQKAFEEFIRNGGGFAGIHAASDTEYEWPWYGRLVGAYFRTHPPVQDATIVVSDRTHASTTMLPERWTRKDEWYSFRSNPRSTAGLHVLMTLDESSYAPGDAGMGGDHPIAWYHEFDGGRAWYTGVGHMKECFDEPLVRAHLLGGITWAAGKQGQPRKWGQPPFSPTPR